MKKLLLSIVASTLWMLLHINPTMAQAQTYTITPNSETFNGKYMDNPFYNHYTKHYYLIRSYLEQLENLGGGTLVLEKGTYTVSNVLYVSSNVTIQLEDGSKIVKGKETGTSKLESDKSIFQLIRPSLGKEEGIYGAHEGEKNISIIGTGTATIDLDFEKDGIAIIAGHNQNIKIKNIHFQNMYSGHFIEIDATKDAVISNNTFKYSKPSPTKIKEAINIDTPDRLTNGWNSKWSKFDKTPNVNLTIENNTFYDLDRAIGTHKYSGGKYHDHIIIKHNKIENMRQDAIRVLNWSNSTIENNYFMKVEAGKNNANRGILASGAHNPTFQNNIFEGMPRAIQFIAWKNSDSGSIYDVTYNVLNDENKDALTTNYVTNSVENFIRINPTFKKYDNLHTEFIPVKNPTQPFSLPTGSMNYSPRLNFTIQNTSKFISLGN